MPDYKSIMLGYLAEAAEIEGDTLHGWQAINLLLDKAVAVCEKRIQEFSDEEDTQINEALKHDPRCCCDACFDLIARGSNSKMADYFCNRYRVNEGADSIAMTQQLQRMGMADTAERLDEESA